MSSALAPAQTLRHSGPILATLCLAWVLQEMAPRYYESVVQEDGPVEWLTFWTFAVAGALALATAWSKRSQREPAPQTGPLTWVFFSLLGLGCLLIAGEEISWGQRLIGYQPPERFLADNYQQELNLHNLASTGARKLALTGLLVAFGVLYPLLSHLTSTRTLLGRLGVPLLPLSFVPAFLALTLVYLTYPWDYTGEWVELGAGIGFLQGVLSMSQPRQAQAAGFAALAVGLGIATPALQSSIQDPGRTALAELETLALAEDFAVKRYRSRCGVHKRLYTFVEEYGGVPLRDTAYGQLPTDDRDTSVRRRYYLDPWNLPYWVRHTCSEDRQQSRIVVYSFGPNRRRDSDALDLRPDDVSAVVNRPQSR